MTILDKVLSEQPSDEKILKEFKNRQLVTKNESYYHIICDNNHYSISGHYSTKSNSKINAMMKYEI